MDRSFREYKNTGNMRASNHSLLRTAHKLAVRKAKSFCLRMTQRMNKTSFRIMTGTLAALGILSLAGCWFPLSEGRDVVLDFPIVKRQWVPDPRPTHVGTLYIVAKGTVADLARHTDLYSVVTNPSDDPRFRHTSCDAPWWTPPGKTTYMLWKATIDHPPLSPDAHYDAS